MRHSLFAIIVLFLCQFALFALDEETCRDIITSEKLRYEKVIGQELELNGYTFSKLEGYIQTDFIINGTPLRVISADDATKFRKELREVFGLNAGTFSEKGEYYIYTKYNNVVAAKGDLKRGDVVYFTAPDLKKHSFIVDSFVFENDNKISLLKPLYNSRTYKDAKLIRKKNPYFLDTTYSLSFINYFRHIIQTELKLTFSYPVLLKVGLRNDVLTDFSFGFEENVTGLSLGLECMLPIDYLFSKYTSLILYTEFNSFFALSVPASKFTYASDVGVGLMWYLKSDFALKFGARFLNIGGLYDFHVPSVQLGCSTIL